ncbi:phage virion morphogenesis protein [Fischerella thermalis CCMEE 5273]|nr:phage virion morphogenesis protein [Fischerella thermalis CCMEE 5273]
MANLTIRVDDREIQQALGQLQTRLSNLLPVFKNIGEYMVLATTERFDNEVDPQGNSWHPLTTATIARKQRKGKILKILQQDGDLRRTIVYQASVDRVEIGTNRIYGAIHQFGGQAGRRRSVTIPARPFLGVSESDKSEILAIIEDYLSSLSSS